MRRAIILILLLALTASAAAENGWIMCQPDSLVNIRENPRKTAAVVAYGYAGDEIELDGKSRGAWLHCIIPSETGEGWVRKDYVSLDEPEDIGSGVFETTLGSVRVRASAGGRVLRRIKKGATVTVSMVTTEWCVTNLGFIQTRCLMEVNP